MSAWDSKLPEGFYYVNGFPKYMVNDQGEVRDISTKARVRPKKEGRGKKAIERLRLRDGALVVDIRLDHIMDTSLPKF